MPDQVPGPASRRSAVAVVGGRLVGARPLPAGDRHFILGDLPVVGKPALAGGGVSETRSLSTTTASERSSD